MEGRVEQVDGLDQRLHIISLRELDVRMPVTDQARQHLGGGRDYGPCVVGVGGILEDCKSKVYQEDLSGRDLDNDVGWTDVAV